MHTLPTLAQAVLTLTLLSGEEIKTGPMPPQVCEAAAEHWRENAARVIERRNLTPSEVVSARCRRAD